MSNIDLGDYDIKYHVVEDEIRADVDDFWEFINDVKEKAAEHISKNWQETTSKIESKIDELAADYEAKIEALKARHADELNKAKTRHLEVEFAKPVKFDPAIHVDRSKYGYLNADTFNEYGKHKMDTLYVYRDRNFAVGTDSFKFVKITPVEEPIEKDVERKG